MKPQPVFSLLLAGFLLWSAAFLGLYGVQATGCRLGWDTITIWGSVSLLRLLLVVGLILSLIAMGLLLAGIRRLQIVGNFTREVAVYLTVAAFISSIVTFFGILWLTLC